MIIIGAGMAGLLAGHMLRRHSPRILEAQAELPNNHAALLRFRTPLVAEATGLPFRKVQIQKAVMSDILSNEVTLADNNAYSRKVTGEVQSRSVLNIESAQRYIAPETFISEMAKGLDIMYNFPVRSLDDLQEVTPPIISTIPMPVLMKLAGWTAPKFRWVPVWTATTFITEPPIDVYQTIYYPGHQAYYRASITGNRVSIEYVKEPTTPMLHVAEVLWDFGLQDTAQFIDVTMKRQEYGKLLPIDEEERKLFIMAMTDQYGIWSLGRFGTWRQILLDDVVEDVRFIDRVITKKDHYHRRIHHHNS